MIQLYHFAEIHMKYIIYYDIFGYINYFVMQVMEWLNIEFKLYLIYCEI